MAIDDLFKKACNQLKTHNKQLNDKFNELNNNFLRFKFIWSISVLHDDLAKLIDSYQFKDNKIPTRANECRKEGNELFKGKNFEDAIKKYNESLTYALNPLKSSDYDTSPLIDELALSYGNRSAVFFHLNEFNLCLNDIEQAFKYKYPMNLRSKLYERKIQCLIKLERYDDLELLLNSKMDDLKLDSKAIDTYKVALSEKKSSKRHDEAKNKFIYEKVPIELDDNLKNSEIPSATDKLIIKYLPDHGYHIRSTKKINVGEFLVDESPFASVLIGEFINEYCFECMHALNHLKMNITPCRQCSYVIFCSKRCEKTAWQNHHKYECKYLKLLALESGLTHMEWLSLRIVLKETFDRLNDLKSDLLKYEKDFESLPRSEISYEFPYKSDSYENIFYLMTNSFLRKSSDLFRRAYIAMFLTKFLIKVEFMKVKDEVINNENACFVGGLLLRHSQSISCNAHEISRLKITETGKNALANSTANGIGAGIYALMSIFNHSCHPQITRNFSGTSCQVRAIHAINENEEIFDNYGVVYAVNDWRERQEKLVDQYFFNCSCVACKENWPLYDKIRSELKLSDIKCLKCIKLKEKDQPKECSICITEYDCVNLIKLDADEQLRLMLKINKRTNIEMIENKKIIEKMIESYCSYLQKLEEYKVKRPFRDYNNFEEALKQCLNIINMN